VGEEQITGYQLRDIFDENKSIEVVKKKLLHKVATNLLYLKGQAKDKEDVDEEEKKKDDKDVPDVDIEAMLKGLGLGECLPKLKEHEIAELEMFFQLEDDKIIELLEIKTEGKKLRFKDKMKEVKDKHEKAKAKKETKDDLSEVVTETFELLKRRSSILF